MNNICVTASKFDNCNNKGQTVKKRRTEIEISVRKEAATGRKALMDMLRPIQKDVFQCLESNELSSLVIIPTGSGKTLLMSVLACKTKCSIVFAPYTLLKNELYAALNEKGATHWWPLPDGSKSLDAILCNANYILMSYEAAPTCAFLLLALNRINRLGPIFVDEVCRPIWLQHRYVTVMYICHIYNIGTQSVNQRTIQRSIRFLLELGCRT